MTDEQPKALWLADMLEKGFRVDGPDWEAAAELRRLHALCDEMAAIVKSVARTILHTVPGEKDCRCSQCELAKEARAIYTKWKESK
jgi:LSD1 subclass zinc finger protein